MIDIFIPPDIKITPPPAGLDPAAHYSVSRGALPHDRDILPGMSVWTEDRPRGQFLGLTPYPRPGGMPLVECVIVEVTSWRVVFRVAREDETP